MDDRIKRLLEYVRIHASHNVAAGLEHYILSLEAELNSPFPAIKVGDVLKALYDEDRRALMVKVKMSQAVKCKEEDGP